jgi:hypothetical protein
VAYQNSHSARPEPESQVFRVRSHKSKFKNNLWTVSFRSEGKRASEQIKSTCASSTTRDRLESFPAQPRNDSARGRSKENLMAKHIGVVSRSLLVVGLTSAYLELLVGREFIETVQGHTEFFSSQSPQPARRTILTPRSTRQHTLNRVVSWYLS